MIKLSPFAPTPYCSPAMEVDGLYFVKAPGDKFLSIYARYKNSTCWVPMHIGIPALQTLQQVRDVDRNISIDSGSYENAHFYLRSADGNNMTAAYFTNGDGGAIQVGNITGYQPLDLQPQGGLLMYRGLEVATKSWVQDAGIFAPISHVGAGGNAHALATAAAAGFMSPADKTKLDNLTQGITEETDPTVPAHVKAITTANISSWNAKENSSNKSTTTTLGTSNTLFPTQNAVKVYVDTAITNNNGNYIPATQKGAVNGVATLGGDGKIPNTQLPALAITETFVVNSQAAMLALSSAGTGDIAVRTDINKSFILTNNTPGTLSSWQELLSPTITSTDQVPEGSNNLYYTIQRARQSVSAGNGIGYNSTTGVVTNTAPDQPSDLAIGTRTDTTMPVTNSNGTGVTLPAATTTQAGLLSGTDKTKLNSLSNYTLPTASASVLGGVKVGSGLSINATTGVLTATNTANGTVTNVTGTAPVNVTNGTTAPVISMTQAGSAANGWLSSADWNTFKNKLDNPGGNAGQFIDGTGTARDLVYKTPGTGTTYSGQYSKIARVEISTQYQDINARIELNLFNYSLASQLRSEIWLRVKQQAAFGNDPVIEAIHENPMATAQYELYYVIVQNTPSTILDVYVRPMGSNYAISFAPLVWPRTGAGSSVTFTPDSAYVASVAGAIGFTTRVPATRDWVAAQGYRTDIPNLQQVAAVGNTAGTDLYIGAGTNAVRVGAGTGVENTILGKDALTAATATAYWNVAIGTHALKSHTTGRNNTAVGESSMANYVSNPDNVFNNNTAVGNSSMLGNISGKSNTVIGTNAGSTDALRDRGDYNVFIGSNAGYNTSTATTPLGDYNIFIGPFAGVNESGSYKFVVGYNTINEPSTPFLYGDMSAGTLDINADTTFSDTIKAPATPAYTTGGYTILALNTTTGTIEKVSSLPFALESVAINAGNGLTGGGNLSANRTIAMGTPSAITLSSANSASGTTHSHAFAPGGTAAQYIRGDGTLATFPAIPGTPDLQQVTDAGGATTANVMLGGQLTVGATNPPKTFAADAAFLPGYTPNTEIITGSSSGVAYSEAVVIRHNGSGGTGALQRELGLIFKMNADTNAAESQKMGAIMMRSLNGFSNNPDMLFFTRNAERMRILDNGNVGIGTTSTISKMEVSRGTGSSADPIIAASQNGGSIALKNGTLNATQFAPIIQGTQVANNSFGLAMVGSGADTYSQAAVVIRGYNAAGDGAPTGKLLSVQAYTTEVISMWANGNFKLAGGNIVLRDSNLKVVKNAASFRASTASTGAIVFKHAPGAPGAMITMKLKGYQYNSGRTFEITLSFYFNGATTISPTGKSAYVIASSALPGLADVYAGFDADGNLSVIIGETTTAWSSYLHLWIDEVTTAHTSYDNATWESGWSAALVSDLTGYTAVTALGLKAVANQDWVQAQGYTTNSGTVTSVNASVSGALSVSGGPITAAGTLAFSWAGTAAQYIRGDGALDAMQVTTYNASNTDITTLVPGTTAGTWVKGTVNGHVVVTIDGNDANDSFNILSNASTSGSEPMTVNLFRLLRNGQLTLSNLIGTGTRMVTASPAGVLSTAAIPAGTVTSVGMTVAGAALNVTPAAITSSGTFSLAWSGTASQYVNGAGNLVAFPTIPAVNNGTLTLATSGIATGSASFTANQAAGSAFTVNVPGTNIATGTDYGAITSSTGSGVTIQSIGRPTINDGNEIPAVTGGLTAYFHSTGSSNYPTVSGGGLKYVRSTGTALGSFHIWTDNTGSDDVYFKTGATASTWNPWIRIASKEWVNSQAFLTAETDPVWLADRPNYMKNLPEGATWNGVMTSGKGQFVSSSVDNPVGSAGVYHGLFIPHSASTTYGTELAFRNGAGHLRSIEAGTIGPWKRIVTPEINTLQATTDAGNATTNSIEITGGTGGRSASATPLGFFMQETTTGTGYGGGLHLRDSTGATTKGGFGFYGTGAYAYIGYGGTLPYSTNRTVAISADGLLITPEGGTTAPTSNLPLQVLANASPGIIARFDRLTEDANSAGLRISSENTFGTKRYADFVINSQSEIAGIGYGTAAASLPIGQTGTTNLGMWVNATNDLFSGRNMTVANTLYIPVLATATAKMLTIGVGGIVSSQDIPAASGTVTSVAATVSGALNVSGSPVTTSGTLAFSWTGTTAQYVRGDGSLATFPAIPAYTGSTSVILSGSSFQRAALTGDVTAAANNNATTIAANAVTYAKMQDAAGLSVIGRSANTAGDPGEITAAADGQVLRRSGTAIGFGTVATAGIADDAVTFAKIQDIASGSLLGRATTGSGDVEALTVGAGLSLSGGVLHADVMVITTSVSYAFGSLTSFVPVMSADFPVPGAEVGDVVMLGLDPAAGSNGVQFKAFVSATGIVKIMAVNCANSSVTLASLPYKIKILK